MYNSDDLELPVFRATREIKRTRVLHKCVECREVIEIGSSVLSVSGKWDGQVKTYYTCDRCNKLALFITDKFRHLGLSLVFGELYQALWELDLIWTDDEIEEEAARILPNYDETKGVVHGETCAIASHAPWLIRVNGHWQLKVIYKTQNQL